MAERGADLFDPRGLPAGDEGMTEMVLFPHPDTRKVIQRFARPMLFVAYDPMNAVAVAKQMIDVAVACGAQVTIEVPRRKISPAVRAVLIQRADHILRSLEDKGKPRPYIVKTLIDQILSSID